VPLFDVIIISYPYQQIPVLINSASDLMLDDILHRRHRSNLLCSKICHGARIACTSLKISGKAMTMLEF